MTTVKPSTPQLAMPHGTRGVLAIEDVPAEQEARQRPARVFPEAEPSDPRSRILEMLGTPNGPKTITETTELLAKELAAEGVNYTKGYVQCAVVCGTIMFVIGFLGMLLFFFSGVAAWKDYMSK